MPTLFRPLSWIHQTDLFRPHADPDDHWDLATVCALAALHRAHLRGVFIDYPPPNPHGFNPDLAAPPTPVNPVNDSHPDAPALDKAGADFILNPLRDSPEPVIIHIVGSC